MNEKYKKVINELLNNNELMEAKLKAYEYQRYLINEHVELSLLMSDILLKEKDYQGAEIILKNRLKMDSSNFKLLSSLGYISQVKNDSDSARVYYSLAKKNCNDLNEIERISDIMANLGDNFTSTNVNKKLVILDDFFPNVKTGFRIAEYNYYLKKYQNCEVYSSDMGFLSNIKEYEDYFPIYKNRVKPLNINIYENYNCSLFYTVFISNAFNYLPIFEINNKPFIFTLYPGGGFCIDNAIQDQKLFIVCNSHLFKKMIVTQKITYDYVIRKGFTTPDKIEFIYGGITDTDYYRNHPFQKKYYKHDKDTFDICFVAAKYMVKGIDKGFDIFIEVCKMLSKINNDIKFHVVGGFNENDIDVLEIKDRIHFYGMRNFEFFPNFYSNMDMIISPNKPFILAPGSFDGFPTGCCVDAGLNGTAILCTDPLNQNIVFEDDKDICLITANISDITDRVIYYMNNLDRLYSLSSNGQKKLFEVYDIEKQMDRRIQLLEEFM